MAHSFQVLFGEGADAADSAFYERVSSIEVEENADLPGAIELTIPVTRTSGDDLDIVGDDRFSPYARIAVVVSVTGKTDACIFDGYVLSHRIHLDRATAGSSVRVWGQDATCLMNLEEKAHEWSDSDETIASTIFDRYGITPSGDNSEDPSAALDSENGPTLMQRATDARFLQDRARRNGKLFRLAGGSRAGEVIGYLAKPKLDGTEVATLRLNPASQATVDTLEITWDIARPTEVAAHALAKTKDSVDGSATESGLALLDTTSLSSFAGRAMSTRLTATAIDAGDLQQRSKALLREAGWFVRCQGEAHLSRLDTVLRVGTVVRVDGAGGLHSGKYYVWSVRHTITAETHRMAFVLVRNAVGARS